MHPTPPPGGTPRGRRGNGLSAGEWGALVDVDPRLSDQLLERLRAAGVAAHVEPAGATTDPVSRAGTMPARPLDRLWVDVSRADAARGVVEAEAEDVVASLHEAGGVEQFLHTVPRGASGRVIKPPPRIAAGADQHVAAAEPSGDGGAARPADGSGTTDSDDAWRAIVEGFNRSAEEPVPPWPVEEDVPDEPSRRRRTDPPSSDAPSRRRPDRLPGEGLPGWTEPEALPDEGHYVPPPPPPTPRLQPRTIAAVAAVVVGVLMLFAPSLFDVAPGGGSYLLGILLMGGGAAALVYWMRDAPGPDDGPDDGAVV